MNWKDFFYFQRGEQVAIVLLLVFVVLGVLLSMTVFKHRSSDIALLNNDSIVRQIDEFRASLQERERQLDFSVLPRETERDDTHRPIQPTTQSPRPTNLPNTQNRTIVQRTAFPRSPRLADGETISLNDSDTLQWMKIPGIGSVFSNRIVRYQARLGGFSSIYQLLEVNGITEELFERIVPYISHNDSSVQKLAVNQLEFSDLLRHPYLEFEQVQAMMNLRRRTGRINSINELAMLREFEAQDIERLRPYLAF